VTLGKTNVFISHKHEDRFIACVFANFIRTASDERVGAHVSSDPEYEGPHGSKPLCEELMQALEDAGCVILVYTGPKDSDYCMFECGAAVGQKIPLHVFQCCDADPPPLRHLVRYKADTLEDVQRFVGDFLTQKNFLRGQDEALTGYGKNNSQVAITAEDLHKRLSEAIDKTDERRDEWSPWPSIRLSVKSQSMKEICHTADNTSGGSYNQAEEIKRMQSLLEEQAVVSYVEPEFSLLTGVSVEKNEMFSSLKRSWLRRYHPTEKMAYPPASGGASRRPFTA
jgi:hypothetical protein